MTVGLARKLSRTKPHRDALLKNMVTQLLQHGSIVSTHEKCKEASRLAERVISWAKKVNENPSSPLRSEIQSRLFLAGDNSKLMGRLLGEIAPNYVGRNGGYTRVLHLERRLGDKAKQSVLELVNTPVIDSEGNFNRGNMKLWLLVKNTMHDESCHKPYSSLTLKSLKKMLVGKTPEQLRSEILAVRRFLKEHQGEEWNETIETGVVDVLLEQMQGPGSSATKKGKKNGGYAFVSQRPVRDFAPAP
ncbi:hypothetical protein HG536_0F01960 [Torulaspora globosa]|uniref:Large ribosomal subunit protein bL17m C-terminal fungi domain-containing protein n=1 Tax=Torulaspora globosa TaxID=48254 RepID=A0A7G3ZK35_9SACH|nr:uncharacterized protein HG536_0F01960 [Torulaspora globosa]QLL33871.1 hypothetical protein HG536_0F01960 [Torulaspora globosa]